MKFFKWQRSSQDAQRPGDSAFMTDLKESLLTQTTPGSKAILYLIGTVALVGLVWANFATVEEVTQGEAKIVSKSREQVIQSLEGGILEEMNVHEGDIVKKGQVLLRIDETRAKTAYKEAFSKFVGLQATIDRLRAEAYEGPLVFSDEVKKVPSEVDLETHTYQARHRSLQDSIASIQQSYKLAMQEINLAQPLADRGLMSQVEMLRMRRQANDLQMQIVQQRNRFQADANSELTKLELEITQVRENLIGRADILARTTVTAPVYGTVKNVRFNTVGGVIQPGEKILEIVPLEDQLLVEGKIKPSDVAFLRPGLPAMVKISAYDFGVYGGLKGKVELVSADTLKDDEKAASGRPDATYYRVTVLTDSNALEAGGKRLPIIPGMTATMEIRTGKKTILQYLLKPVFKAREAFRER